MAQPNVLTKAPIEVTEVNSSSQNDSSLYGLPYWLGIGEFFLIQENINKKYEGYWDYDKIYSLLRSWAREINPGLDENPSLSDIIKTLRDPENSQTIQKSNSVDLEQLDYLIKKLEEANVVSKESADLARQIKKAFMDSLVRKAETENNYLSFLKTAVQKLTTSPIEPNQIEKVAQAISANLEIDRNYLIEAIKAKDSTEQTTEQNLLIRQEKIWGDAISKAISRLKETGLDLNQTQIAQLEAMPFGFILEKITELQEKEAQDNIQSQSHTEITERQIERIKAQVASTIKEALIPTKEAPGTIEPLQRERVAKAISDSLEINEIVSERTKLPVSPSTVSEKTPSTSWTEAIDQAVVQLETRGIRLRPEQIVYLKAIPIDVVLGQIVQSQDPGVLFEVQNLDKKIAPLIAAVLQPNQSSRLQDVVKLVTPLVFVNTQPVSGIDSKTASPQDIRDIRTRIQNETILSLSQIALKIVEKGIVLTPVETAKVLAVFSISENEIRNLLKTQFLSKSPFEKAIILQSSNQGLIEAVKNFPIVDTVIASFSPYLRTETGKTVVVTLKERLFRSGINRDSVPFFKMQMDRLKMFEIVALGLTPNTLEKALNFKIKLGLSPGSPEAKELTALIPAVRKYLLENPQLQRKLRGLEKAGIYLLPRSENGTLISVQKSTVILTIASTLLTKAKPLLGNLFGKTNVKFINTALFITNSRFSFAKKGLENLGRDFLFNTTTGKSIFKFFQGDRQAFLQNLFSMNFPSREGLNLPNIKLGRTISRIGDTSISARALRFVTNKGYDLLVSQNSILTRFIGTTQNLISHITNTSLAPRNMAKWAFLLVGVVLVFQFMSLTIIGGALVSKAGPVSNEYGGDTSGIPPNCTNPNHFAEQVVCVLKECNQSFVTSSTISEVVDCLERSGLQNKEILSSAFSSNTPLSCIIFVYAIEKAIGHNLENSISDVKNACNYFTSPPSNYELISGTEIPQKGDIAVWNATSCGGTGKDPRTASVVFGHSAIVLGSDGHTLTAAEANGFTGQVRIKSYFFGNPEDSVSPNGFLHYKGR